MKNNQVLMTFITPVLLNDNERIKIKEMLSFSEKVYNC